MFFSAAARVGGGGGPLNLRSAAGFKPVPCPPEAAYSVTVFCFGGFGTRPVLFPPSLPKRSTVAPQYLDDALKVP